MENWNTGVIIALLTLALLLMTMGIGIASGWFLSRLLAKRRVAKMESAGPLTEEAIAEALVGTASAPIVKAINAKITMKIVDLSDRATDAPRETLQIRGETMAGYTADQRMHDAGGAAHLADLLAELQELTKARATEG